MTDPLDRLHALLADYEEERAGLLRQVEVLDGCVGTLRGLLLRLAPPPPPVIHSPALQEAWGQDKGLIAALPSREEYEQEAAAEEAAPTNGGKSRRTMTYVTQEQVRDVAVEFRRTPPPPVHGAARGYFTISQVATALGCSATNGKLMSYLAAMHASGQLESRPYKGGRQYRYAKPTGDSPPRPRQPPPEAQFIGSAPSGRGGAVAHANKTYPKSSSREVNAILARAWAAGWQIRRDRTGHISCYNPSGPHAGERLGVSSSPGPSAIRAIESQFKAWGLV